MPAPPPLPVYFAYGSNLEPDQMRARCPGSRVLCRAILPDHVLVFRGFSRDWEGAVATVEPAPGEVVHGVVFEVTPADVESLDRYEGYLGPQHAANLYDRVRWSRGVVDFIGPVDLGFANFPIFNVADIAITCGAGLLAISFWLEERAERRAAARAPEVPPPPREYRGV